MIWPSLLGAWGPWSDSAARKRIAMSLIAAIGLVTLGVVAGPQTVGAAPIACTTADLLTAISAANGQVGGGTVSLAPACT